MKRRSKRVGDFISNLFLNQPHILEAIFGELNPSDLESCEQVCKRWNNYFSNNQRLCGMKIWAVGPSRGIRVSKTAALLHKRICRIIYEEPLLILFLEYDGGYPFMVYKDWKLVHESNLPKECNYIGMVPSEGNKNYINLKDVIVLTCSTGIFSLDKHIFRVLEINSDWLESRKVYKKIPEHIIVAPWLDNPENGNAIQLIALPIYNGDNNNGFLRYMYVKYIRDVNDVNTNIIDRTDEVIHPVPPSQPNFRLKLLVQDKLMLLQSVKWNGRVLSGRKVKKTTLITVKDAAARFISYKDFELHVPHGHFSSEKQGVSTSKNNEYFLLCQKLLSGQGTQITCFCIEKAKYIWHINVAEFVDALWEGDERVFYIVRLKKDDSLSYNLQCWDSTSNKRTNNLVLSKCPNDDLKLVPYQMLYLSPRRIIVAIQSMSKKDHSKPTGDVVFATIEAKNSKTIVVKTCVVWESSNAILKPSNCGDMPINLFCLPDRARGNLMVFKHCKCKCHFSGASRGAIYGLSLGDNRCLGETVEGLNVYLESAWL